MSTARWPDVIPFACAIAERMACRRVFVAGVGAHAGTQPPSAGVDIASVDLGRPLRTTALLDDEALLVLGPEAPRDWVGDVLQADIDPAGIVVATQQADLAGRARSDALNAYASWLAQTGHTPVVSGWTRDTADRADRNTQLHLSATGMGEAPHQVPTWFDVLAVVPVYNERDVIETTLERLSQQGLRVHVLDNWSDDGSFEAVQQRAGHDPGLTVERFPASPSAHYEWSTILDRLDAVAAGSSAQWILHVDADEQFDAFGPGRGLREAIYQVERSGYDAIDCTVVDFRPTAESVAAQALPQFWEFGLRTGHLHIQRGWRNRGRAIGLSSSGGHVVPDPKRLYPLNFVLRHYPLRSPEHARQKIYRDRMPRISGSADRTRKGWHRQYDGFRADDPFLWDSADLLPWDDATRLDRMPELTTRTGLIFGEGSYRTSPFEAGGAD